MKILTTRKMQPTLDGDGVKIQRIADFKNQQFDPFLMIDEIKSDDEADFVGGFPPHPHRGIETFTYILTGGFEHRDQMGNVKQIRAGDVQWMSTGSGVIHSEMPLVDEHKKMHGFQIWLNMPAKDKMRPSRYQDSISGALPVIEDGNGARLKLLAGDWQFADQQQTSPLQALASDGGIADLTLSSGHQATLNLSQYQSVLVYLYQGNIHSGLDNLQQLSQGWLAIADPRQILRIKAGDKGAGMLIFRGNKINEKIVHYGPFVMNTMAEINQTIDDFQQGRFGQIAS